MKICPRCRTSYADDNLNFCLEDGTPLAVASSVGMEDTIVMEEPRVTRPQPTRTQTGAPPGLQQQNAMPQQQKKSSRTWVWVLLILGVLVLLCGGGFVGFLFWASTQVDKTTNTLLNNIDKWASPSPSSTRTTATATTDTDSTSERTSVTEVDLNMFVKDFSLYGTTEMVGDELTMGSIKKGFYYVLVAPDENTTEDADTRVTVRNINDAASSLGYGLIFHSNPQPLQQDYAFLIDTKRKKYEIVHHEPQKETPVVKWTASPAIKGGTEENTLEVRDMPDKIEFYINGTMVNSTTNTFGYPGGVAGLYSGDGVKIAFKDLEIRR